MFYLAAGFDVYARLFIQALANTLNTRAPGHGAFQGCYYDMEQDCCAAAGDFVTHGSCAPVAPSSAVELARLAPVYQGRRAEQPS